jgi:hypothetical protein
VEEAAGLRAEITAAMHVGMWTSTDGVSEELNRAYELAAASAEAETDPELQEDFERARARLDHLVTEELRRNPEDYEE